MPDEFKSDDLVSFKLCARDPSGEFVRRWHWAAIVPRIGDILNLKDGDDWQDICVDGVSLFPDGTIEVWAESFDGWAPGSVKRLFEEPSSTSPGPAAFSAGSSA